MRCPKCQDKGKKHEVDKHGSYRTCMAGRGTFYDENNVRHYHDPNTTMTSYICSNNHKWTTKSVTECPAPGCNQGYPPVLMDSSWGEGVGRWGEPTQEMIERLKS